MEGHSSGSRDPEDPAAGRNSNDNGSNDGNDSSNSRHAVNTASLAAHPSIISSSSTPFTPSQLAGASSASSDTTSSDVTARQGRQHTATASVSSSNSKKLAQAEAAAAAALGGSLNPPALSNNNASSPSSSLPASVSGAGGHQGGVNNDGGIGMSNMTRGGASKGEGTITNTASIGPPTPSATRLPFLPSALKKPSTSNSNNTTNNNNSNNAFNSRSQTSSASSVEGSDRNRLTSAALKAEKNRRKEMKKENKLHSLISGTKTSSSHKSSHNNKDINNEIIDQNSIPTNAYEKSYHASSTKIQSKRDREEAREEREKERLYGINMGNNTTTTTSSSLMPSSSTSSTVSPQQHQQQPSGNSSTLPLSSQLSNNSNPIDFMQSKTEGWPLNHTTKGTGISSSNSITDFGGQPLSKKKSKTPSRKNDVTSSPSSIPHFQESTSLGFASPHMSPALGEAGQGVFTGDNSFIRPSNNTPSKTGPGTGSVNTSRFGKSKKTSTTQSSSTNNGRSQRSVNEGQHNYLDHKNGVLNNNNNEGDNGEGGDNNTTSMRKRNGNNDNNGGGDLLGEDSETERINARSKRKDIQLQFSPKVSSKKQLNISWKSIKRKFLLASTGTPSSGEGSRRSETSETSGGSRRRMYAAHNAAHQNNNSNNSHHGEKTVHIDDGLGEEGWEVDQVVVDNDWFDDEGNPILWGGSTPSGSAVNGAGGNNAQNSHNGAGDKHGHHNHHTHHGAAGSSGEKVSNSGRDTNTNRSETAGSLIINPTIKVIDGVVTFFKGYLIPKCAYFFEPRFGDAEKELNFRKERWYNTKRNAAFGCFFLILNWILLIALIKMQGIYQKVLYYGVLTLFVMPMPFFVAFDLPRTWPNFYSFWGMTAAMLPGLFGIISMYVCHFLIDGSMACNGQTFLTIHYYTTAFAVVALFALHINRLAAVCWQIALWILICVMLLPEAASYARTAVNFLIFSAFIVYLHFQQEKIDRRMFTLRTQLKISYRALQKSQIAEKKAANSKKRFISYIFHEVRVPLNTAYLAFQNLQHSNGFNRQDEDQMVEVYALESSLQQVQQVLNDVLDLQRMDAGKFESSSQPFNFHRAINALVASLKVAATAKRLKLDVQLDEAIDNLPQSMDVNGQKASYVIGDEIRLRQVLTNIASNAVKFSREGKGGIKVRTKLIWPVQDEEGEYDDGEGNEQRRISQGTATSGEGPSEGLRADTEWRDTDITPTNPNSSKDTPYTESEMTFTGAIGRRTSRERDIEKEAGLETDIGRANDGKAKDFNQPTSYPPTPSRPRSPLPRQDSHESDGSNSYGSKRRKDFVIVRIEIEDNGPGIRPSDMVDQRLFSAYVQTEIGRVQGGKGSGLGLAIVRAIVQMTRGRLGVQSSSKGTTFWIEQRYHFATQQEVEALQALQDLPTPYSFNTEEPISKPVRPPVKPYKTGESSYSQFSASKMDGISQNEPPLLSTPSSETDRPLLMAAGGGLPSPTQLEASHNNTANMSAEHIRAASSSISSLPSMVSGGNSSTVGNTSATNAMDIHSPLTSEQWSQNNVERSVMPTMSVTSPTPPTQNTPSVNSPSSQPVPSPTRSSLSQQIPLPSPANSATPTYGSGQNKVYPPSANRTFSDDANSAMSVAGSSKSTGQAGSVPFESPMGEDAFTPMTRQIVTTSTPDGENPPPRDGRVSPLPMPPPARSRLSSQSSTPSVAPFQSSASGATANNNGERLNALVVDDDPLTRKLMSRMMTRLGCKVEDAENGQMFLDIALGNKEQGREPKLFDIVTLDNAMPVMTGEEAIKVFRRAGRKDLVVGATGNALKGDQNSYLRAGVDTVLTKPISARDLTAQLTVARRRRQLAEEVVARLADETAAASASSASTQ